MTTFTLTALIKNSDLTTIARADQKIVLVKSLFAQDPANVAWVVIDPSQTNVASWNDSYGIYASQTEVVDRNVIQVSAPLPNAQAQFKYKFQENNLFSAPIGDPTLKPGQYRIENQNPGRSGFTFGMMQDITASGRLQTKMPTNAGFVPKFNIATFEPLEKVSIFLSSAIQSGQITTVPPATLATAVTRATLVMAVTSLSTVLTFSNTVTDIAIEYNSNLAKFFQIPSTMG